MFFATLEHSALLHFSGNDACAFLHAQLTSDVGGLALNNSQYSGYCTPKGRLLASFLLWRNESGYVLQLPAVLREAVHKRLSMYILRSKVKVSDASAEYALMGIAGDGAADVLRRIAGEVPTAPHDVVHGNGVTALKLPVDRYQIVVLRTRADEMCAALAVDADAGDATCWNWLDIHAGIATILPATQEEFVPQMVNFDAIGAVSFNKGCYPGQEIVARMHYLGKLKQRMVLAHVTTDVAPCPGDKLYSANLGDQANGMIANAAPAPGGGHDVLAVIQTASMGTESVHLLTPDGPLLELLPLPYRI